MPTELPAPTLELIHKTYEQMLTELVEDGPLTTDLALRQHALDMAVSHHVNIILDGTLSEKEKTILLTGMLAHVNAGIMVETQIAENNLQRQHPLLDAVEYFTDEVPYSTPFGQDVLQVMQECEISDPIPYINANLTPDSVRSWSVVTAMTALDALNEACSPHNIEVLPYLNISIVISYMDSIQAMMSNLKRIGPSH